jgi:hypothetical protein
MKKIAGVPTTSGGIMVIPSSPTPTPQELSYAAGFVDGEGCITITKTQPTEGDRPVYRLRLEVSQNCHHTLTMMVQRIGVPAKVRPMAPQKRQTRPSWRVIYDGPQAYAALRNLKPYLVRKQAEAELAIEFVEEGVASLRPGRKGTPEQIWKKREGICRRMRRLK